MKRLIKIFSGRTAELISDEINDFAKTEKLTIVNHSMVAIQDRMYVAVVFDSCNEPTAEWIISSDGYYPYCSNCKNEPKNGIKSKYCPECGASMRKEKYL